MVLQKKPDQGDVVMERKVNTVATTTDIARKLLKNDS